MKLWCKKIKLYPSGIKPRPELVASSRRLNHYTIETLLQITVFDMKCSLLHHNMLGNIPEIAGKTKLGQFPAIAGKKPCYSRDWSWAYISLL